MGGEWLGYVRDTGGEWLGGVCGRGGDCLVSAARWGCPGASATNWLRVGVEVDLSDLELVRGNEHDLRDDERVLEIGWLTECVFLLLC